jgi:hypothetical protein
MSTSQIKNRTRSNTMPIGKKPLFNKKDDSSPVATTPTNTPSTPFIKGLSGSSSSHDFFCIGSYGKKYSTLKLFELDRS